MNEREVQKIKLQNTVLFAVIIAMAAVVLACIGVYRYRHTFTVDKWNADAENRMKMVDNLFKKHQIIGMQEADVVALLGEEDSEGTSFKISREEFPPDTTLVYYLGGDFMDNQWLVLSLKDGVVCDYCIDIS